MGCKCNHDAFRVFKCPLQTPSGHTAKFHLTSICVLTTQLLSNEIVSDTISISKPSRVTIYHNVNDIFIYFLFCKKRVSSKRKLFCVSHISKNYFWRAMFVLIYFVCIILKSKYIKVLESENPWMISVFDVCTDIHLIDTSTYAFSSGDSVNPTSRHFLALCVACILGASSLTIANKSQTYPEARNDIASGLNNQLCNKMRQTHEIP